MSTRRRSRVLVLVTACLLVLAACTEAEDDASPPAPTGPTTTTQPLPDYGTVPLAAVGGATTTTIVLRPGDVVIGGVVTGPEGPVAGATVEITRVVGGAEVSERHLTLEDGRWEANGIQGGRYRLRAWRAPDLALTKPEIRYLPARKAEVIPLTVARHSGVAMTATFAPDQPDLDERTTLAIQVVDKRVDAEGIVRAVPRPVASVELRMAAAWSVETQNPARTDGAGVARWIVRCDRRGVHALAVAIDDTDVIPISPPRCGPPPTTTTQPPPTTAAPTTVASG